MRWELSDIWSYRVHARDGTLGAVTDLYFDDVYWQIRYLVVTGGSAKAARRKWLLAPETISRTDRECGLISMALRQAEVHGSPAVAAERTLPRQEESRLRTHYGLADYWPAQPAPGVVAPSPPGDGHQLHSLGAILGYRVCAGPDDIGCLSDLVIDDHSWEIESIEVEANPWLPTKRFWVQPAYIQQVRGSRQQIALTIPREAVLRGLTSEPPPLQAPPVSAPWTALCPAGYPTP